MPKKRGIQYETVAAIADSLVDQGFRPEEISAGAIREETQTGSLSTIIAHLKRWRDQGRPAVSGLDLTADNMVPITAAVKALVNEVSELIREEGRKANAAAAIEAERTRAERDEAYVLNEQIEAEREAAVAEAHDLRAQVEAGRLREANLQGRLDALSELVSLPEPKTTGRGDEEKRPVQGEVMPTSTADDAGESTDTPGVGAAEDPSAMVADAALEEPQLFDKADAQAGDSPA